MENTVSHLLQIHHFRLKALQLLSAVFQIALLLGAQQIVVSGGGHDERFHAGLHPSLEI